MAIAMALHVIAAVIWVGDMFFAYMALRPVAATLLEPPQRLALWSRTFARFFPWVWAAVLILPATGYWVIFAVYGSMANAGLHVHIMQSLGLLMILLYLFVFFVRYRGLNEALAASDIQKAAANLARIRHIIATNLLLGLVVIAVAASGRYW